MESAAKVLVLAGALMMGAGLLLWAAGHLPGGWRLPGDIVWSRGRTTVYVPLATCLLLSLLLTLLFNLWGRR